MKTTVFFDLDGTLVNSLYDLGDSVNEVLRAQGFPEHGYDKYRFFVGNGTLKLIERALPEDQRTPENIQLYHEQFAEEYERRKLCKTAPYEGIPELLEGLKAKGLRLGVISNKPDRFTREIVDALFPGVFDYVAGKREGFHRKPDPQILYAAMEALGANHSQCVHVGDSAVDVQTGHNAGVEVLGVTWGFRPEEELREAGADRIVRAPAEITSLLFSE